MDLTNLTDNTLRVTLASLHATRFLVHSSVQSMHDYQFAAFDQERQHRGLSEVSLDTSLGYGERIVYTESNPRGIFSKTPSKEDLGAFGMSGATDNEVRFFYSIGSEIADDSCLGYGVRDHAELPYYEGRAELCKRGLKWSFLCDLEFDVGVGVGIPTNPLICEKATEWSTKKLLDTFQAACVNRASGSQTEVPECRAELERRLAYLEGGVLGKLDGDQALIVGSDGMIKAHVDRDGMIRITPREIL